MVDSIGLQSTIDREWKSLDGVSNYRKHDMGIFSDHTIRLSFKALNTIKEMRKNSEKVIETSFISDADIISNVNTFYSSTEKLISDEESRLPKQKL